MSKAYETDELGMRMKQYEQVAKTKLLNKTPVVIRLDGKAFHTFTRGFKKPFDMYLMEAMQLTMKYLCENIQNCVLGYTQSDEITLVLIDTKTERTNAWFDNEVQKICSIASSLATLEFNRKFTSLTVDNEYLGRGEFDIYLKAVESGATFDCRCFNLPENEVINCLIWRQQDATKNSIQVLGQANFSHSQLQCKNGKQIQEMLFQEKNLNWNDLPTECKRGSCCVLMDVDIITPNGVVARKKWFIDKEIPIFTQNREYINSCITIKK